MTTNECKVLYLTTIVEIIAHSLLQWIKYKSGIMLQKKK